MTNESTKEFIIDELFCKHVVLIVNRINCPILRKVLIEFHFLTLDIRSTIDTRNKKNKK